MHRRHYLTTTAATISLAALSGCLEDIENQLDGGRSVEDVKENAERVPYEELYRNISDYRDTPVYYPQARIADIISGQNMKEYILTVPGGGFTDEHVIYGLWNGDPYRDGDTIELWGVVQGLTSYQSLTGERTVPEVRLRAINLA